MNGLNGLMSMISSMPDGSLARSLASGDLPQFLVASEMQRRKEARERSATAPPNVAQSLIMEAMQEQEGYADGGMVGTSPLLIERYHDNRPMPLGGEQQHFNLSQPQYLAPMPPPPIQQMPTVSRPAPPAQTADPVAGAIGMASGSGYTGSSDPTAEGPPGAASTGNFGQDLAGFAQAAGGFMGAGPLGNTAMAGLTGGLAAVPGALASAMVGRGLDAAASRGLAAIGNHFGLTSPDVAKGLVEPPSTTLGMIGHMVGQAMTSYANEDVTPGGEAKGDVDGISPAADFGGDGSDPGTAADSANSNSTADGQSGLGNDGTGAGGAGMGAGAPGNDSDGDDGLYAGGPIRMNEGGPVKAPLVPDSAWVPDDEGYYDQIMRGLMDLPSDPRGIEDIPPEDLVQDTGLGSLLLWPFRSRLGRVAGVGGAAAGGYALLPSSREAAPSTTPPAGTQAQQAQQTQQVARPQGGGGSAPPAAPQPQRDARSTERSLMQREYERIARQGEERGGLSPLDMAMIHLGMRMMGSRQRTPLAAMSEGATPAMQTYIALDRNDTQARSDRDRRLADLAYRDAMIGRYDDDRTSREAIAAETRALQLARAAGRGGGSGRSGWTREQWERWINTPQDPSIREQRRQAAREFMGGGGGAPSNDPLAIRPREPAAPVE
jgi:hypothetical protein